MSCLLEAEPELALCASGTNSGILHTGFDSPPGELETRMILRSAQLRDPVLDALGVPVLRTGAVLRPVTTRRARRRSRGWRTTRARTGSRCELAADGALFVPGESVTDPVAFTLAVWPPPRSARARASCAARR